MEVAMAELHYCPKCNNPVEPHQKYCINCGQRLEQNLESLASPASSERLVSPINGLKMQGLQSESTQYIPWEDRKNLGYFKALRETWIESTFHPKKFFPKISANREIWGPLFYVIIIIWIINAIALIIITSIPYEEIPKGLEFLGRLRSFKLLLILIALPVSIAAAVFFVSGIYHLILLTFSKNKYAFEITFRCVAYATGPFIFTIVPVCGFPIALIWAIVLSIIGIKHVHQVT
jgi:hypothetical protein